jgi:hypothetical protein
MEAFRWDDEHMKCVDSLVGEMNPRLPMLHMKPQQGYVPNPKNYISPLYRTAARAGTLSTTGKFDKLAINLQDSILNVCVCVLFYKAIRRTLLSQSIYQVIKNKIIGLARAQRCYVSLQSRLIGYSLLRIVCCQRTHLMFAYYFHLIMRGNFFC